MTRGRVDPEGQGAVGVPKRDAAAGGRGQRAPFPFHPLLIATFPVLAMYSANTDEARVGDVIVVLAAVLAATCLMFLLLRVVFRSLERAALATSLLIALTFSYAWLVGIGSWMQDVDPLPMRTRYWLMVWLAAAGATAGLRIMGVLGRKPARVIGAGLYLVLLLVVTFRMSFLYAWILLAAGLLGLLWLPAFDARRVTGLLNLSSIVLVITSLAATGTAWTRLMGSPAAAGPRSDMEDWADDIVLDAPDSPPDIYFLVFDRYAGAGVLRDHFGYDNTPFTKQLAERGFHVVDGSHANYPKTIMSIHATLDMEYLDDEFVRPNTEYARELESHRVGRLLKRVGYRYYYLGNWAMRRDRQADVNFPVSPLPSEFAEVVYERTPLSSTVIAQTRTSRTRTLRKFDWLYDISAEPGPKLVYAHFLLPHPPFRFGRHGEEVASGGTYEEQYLDQLIYTNDRILQLVDTIIARSARPPIIIVQADEGPRLSGADVGKSRTERIAKRTGILAAYHLPGVDAAGALSATFSPVNTFRVVLREYFGAQVELLEDRVFYWERETPEGMPDTAEPCRIVDVTGEVMRAAAASAAPNAP